MHAVRVLRVLVLDVQVQMPAEGGRGEGITTKGTLFILWRTGVLQGCIRVSCVGAGSGD